ncbi:MAG TPA: PilT/PilU family type 4a pilus ATPase [Chthoniobacteraceae bacterium]|nr:PilT/PilU family type 4a pilus ATPase [Chthoniobacteraceae bacterium]
MHVFEQILHGAIASGASDIHIKAGAPISYRIVQELVPVDAPPPDPEWIERVLNHIVPPHLRERLDREHEIDFAYAPPQFGRFRVNVFQQRGNYVLSMRLVKSAMRDFRALNLPGAVRDIAETPRGIVIIAGATGSGKSTTLAAMIEHINQIARKHIITLEDPIEYLFTDRMSIIEQREVGLDTASFSSGLKNVLRQDPDVLVIGEMRDPASIAAAISAANIGHLVISTLHTADAAKSIQRILEFFPSADRDSARRQLATTLHAVICQKLIASTQGGVLPAVEILIKNSSVEKLISAGNLDKLAGAMEMGGGDGMQTFDQSLYEMVKSGRITQAEAFAHSPAPEALKMRLQGVVLSESRRILGSRE